jgi:hypothetical protein
MRFLVALLALALLALPFGMGAMMSRATAHEAHVHAGHDGHHGKAPAPLHKGKTTEFTMCGACLSLPAQAPAVKSPEWEPMVAMIPAFQPAEGQSQPPVTPPPRA